MTADADDGRCERVNEMWKIWHHAYSQVPFNFLASHYTTHWRDITLAYYNIVKFTWIINERQKWSTTHFQNIHLKFSIPLYALHSKFTVTNCVAKKKYSAYSDHYYRVQHFAIGIFVFEINTYLVINGKKCALQFTHPQVYAKYSQKLCVNRHRVSEWKNSFKFIRNISVCSYSLPPSSSSSWSFVVVIVIKLMWVTV